MERAAKNIVDLVLLLASIVAVLGIFYGAAKMRKGLQSEGFDTLQGSAICLVVISSLYMIIGLVF